MSTSEGEVIAPDGVRLHFEVVGDGDQTVVVPNGTYLREDLDWLSQKYRIVYFDPRNRGRSDAVSDPSRLGIVQDVDDMHAVVCRFSDEAVHVLAHSFACVLAVLYARAYPSRVGRAVLIGPMSLEPDRQFPSSLTNQDETFGRVMSAIGALLQERAAYTPEVFCEKFWSVLTPLYVADERDAGRVRWSRCSLPNERNALRYVNEHTMPSIKRLSLAPGDMAAVAMPVLIVHGRKDRSAPYGAGREWAMALPDARLVSVDRAAHAPWVEAPAVVFGAIETFLGGEWPQVAERITSLSPERVHDPRTADR